MTGYQRRPNTSRRRPSSRSRNRSAHTNRSHDARNRAAQGRLNQGRNKKLPIPIRVALIMVWPILLVQILNAIFFLATYSWLSLITMVLYFIAGLVGGNYWFNDHPRLRHGAEPKAVREGAACGLTMGVINLLLMLILVLLIGALTFSVGMFIGGFSIAICAPSDVIVALFLGAFGGWVSEKTH